MILVWRIITDKRIVTVYYGDGRLMRLIHDNVDKSSAAMSVILIQFDASHVLCRFGIENHISHFRFMQRFSSP